MSEQLIADPAVAQVPRGPRALNWTRLKPSLGQALFVVVAFVVVGAGDGWLWHHLAPTAHGIAYNHEWYGLDEKDFRDAFAGTAIYALIAAGSSVVLGLIAAQFFSREELVTLAAVVLGAGAAALVMYLVGSHLGHADPDAIAKTAKDGTKIPGDLRIGRWTVGLVWPIGGLLGLLVVYFLIPRRMPSTPTSFDAEFFGPTSSGSAPSGSARADVGDDAVGESR